MNSAANAAVRSIACATLAVVTLLCVGLRANPAFGQDEWRFSGAEKIVAVADIHGAYAAFERILKRAELIDDSLRWSGGSAHLVIVGDVLDRGPDSRRALDLIRKLESEAPAVGGRVHFVLGNHEIMNMTGDLRYVSAGEYEAFSDQELVDVREQEFRLYLEAAEQSLGTAEARAAFDMTYPPGFFAHRQAFSLYGEYGAWLIDKPVLLVINDAAFVHGGLAASVVEQESMLNSRLRQELREFLEAHAALVRSGMLSTTVDVYDVPSRMAELLQRAEADKSLLSDENRAYAETLTQLDSTIFFAPDGPVWYRGNVGCNRLTEQDRLSRALRVIDAEHLVVGHTPTQGAVIMSRMGESLLRVDTGMLNDYYGGRASALIIEGDDLVAIYENEPSPSLPIAQPRRVGSRPSNLSAESLEAVLRVAEVGTSTPFDGTATLLRMIYQDQEFLGLFTIVRREGINAAVAAYRLDRLLGLDMVPVTIEREFDGVKGALQYLPIASISEPQRREQGLGASAWCPLGDQFNDMYLFDALIFNEARTLDRIRYSTDNLELLLVGHDQSFSTERGRPDYLDSLPVQLTPAWSSALAELDEELLDEALGEVLDRRGIRALLARRDHLLEIAE
jgi:hypothetical protein